MRISIFGLGYVGIVSAACLAADGHTVIGVDPNKAKVDLTNLGEAPIVEDGLAELIRDAVSAGHLRATGDALDAVLNTEVSFLCVGTPSERNGSLDMRYVRAACEEVGSGLRVKDAFHIVVIRSTMLPGAMRTVVIPMLEEASGKVAGRDFGVCSNPEFMREGTAIQDYRTPPKTVIGELDVRSGLSVAEIYRNLNAPLIRTSVEVAEMVKYVDNLWHATKVTFANEVGNFCKGLALDSHEVMDIFCADTKLNLSSYYLTPGFAFGGSCLPKDVRAFNYRARSLDLDLPLLGALLPSNEMQVDRLCALVMASGLRRVSILGFAFKAGTDDLRESPIVELAERLIGKGLDLRLYDRNVSLAALRGANRDYILNHIPHLSKLMVASLAEAVEHGDLIIIGNKAAEFGDVAVPGASNKRVIDLVRVMPGVRSGNGYEGIAW